jgi:hypothetical protein
MFRLVPVVAACALGQPALAQVMYKCQVDARIAYGDRPCARGEGQVIKVAPAPAPPADGAHAGRRERDTLLQLEKLRLARDMREERERAAAMREQKAQAREQRTHESQQRKCARLRLRQKWADEDRAHLTGKNADAARVKARRDAELLAVECPA